MLILKHAMIVRLYKLKTRDIALVQFIIEGYEGLATVSTLDSKTAMLQVMVMPDFVSEMESLLDYLKERFFMEEFISGNSRVSLC